MQPCPARHTGARTSHEFRWLITHTECLAPLRRPPQCVGDGGEGGGGEGEGGGGEGEAGGGGAGQVETVP